MDCDACGAPMPHEARFCPSCGARASAGPRAEAHETRKAVTIVFCDMVGSTELSELLDPEVLRQVMLGYYARMRDCLTRYGGTVEKFIGDAVMAVFGVPRVHEDDALRAVFSATDMLTAVERLNERLSDEIGTRIAVRIGVNTGEVVATQGQAAGDGLISGETVNVAARLEQLAGPGEVLLGPDTYRMVSGAIISEPVGPVRLKGKADPVTAHRLLDLNPDSPAVPSPFDVPLIGRQRELELLVGVFALARSERRCRLVRVLGEAGVGKSRLARDYAAHCARAGAAVEVGHCRPYGEGGTLAMLVDTVGRLARAAGGDLAAESVDELVGAACVVLRREAGRRPVLLVLDDLQWADSALHDSVETIASRLDDVPVVLLCLSRIEAGQAEQAPPPGVAATSLMLTPLSMDVSRQLVAQLSDVLGHEVSVVDRIVERAGGNPLFLEQLVAMLREESTAGNLPPTIRALIEARLDLIAVAEREAIELASVVGRRFTTSAVEALAGPAGPAPGEEWSQLCRLRLVERLNRSAGGDVAYRFASELIHEVTYDSMSRRRRATLHERLADWWEAADGDDAVIGTHLEQAYGHQTTLGRSDRAIQRLKERAFGRLALAGDTALRRGDVRWSVNLLGRSARLADDDDPQRLRVLAGLAEATVAGGQVEVGRRLLQDLRRQALMSGDAGIEAHARLQLAYLDTETEQLDASLATAREVLPVFEKERDYLGMARAWLRIGQAEQAHGRYAAAISALSTASAHAKLANAELERATALGAYAISLWLGPEPADSAIARCLALLAELNGGRRTAVAALSCPLAMLEAMVGEHGTALERLAEAERIVTELGHAYALASVHVFRAGVLSMADDLDGADTELERARDACARLGDTQLRVTASRDLARVLLRAGRQVEAVAAMGDALSGLAGRVPASSADLAGLRAQVEAGLGHSDAALALTAQARTTAAGTDSPACQATACLDTAMTLRTLGDIGGARAWADRARLHFRQKGHLVGERHAGLLARLLAGLPAGDET